jgi:signal-transduction protein with cAMP-binding, CBS, and nucleotidyltransferase domain
LHYFLSDHLGSTSLILGKDPATMKVDQIMTAPLVSVEIKTPIYEIYRTMSDHQIQHLLITDGGQQVEFVSMKDLISQPVF